MISEPVTARTSDADRGTKMSTKSSTSSESRRRQRRTPRRPASSLAERWIEVDGIDVFYRESPDPPDAPVMMHVHGFGLSGRYLLPTAERLADDFHTLVPDLPGFGRSGKAADRLDVPDLADCRREVPRRPRDRAGDARRQLDGLSGHHRVRVPLSRPHRPRGARLTGGRHLQPAAPPRDGADQPRRHARAAATHAAS